MQASKSVPMPVSHFSLHQLPIMPRDTDVLCGHCNTYMPRRREREHRQLINSPFDLPTPTFLSQLQSVVDAGSDHEDGGFNLDVPMDLYEETMDMADEDAEHVDPANSEVTAVIHQDAFEVHWRLPHRATVESDDEDDGEGEDDMDVDEEGANDGEWDEEYIDWVAIEAASGLSAWDRLGESFENEAATTGTNRPFYIIHSPNCVSLSQSTYCI